MSSQSLEAFPCRSGFFRFATSFFLREFLLAAARAPSSVRPCSPSTLHHFLAMRDELPHEFGLGPSPPVLLIRPSTSFFPLKRSRLLALVRVAPGRVVLVDVQNIVRRQ